MTESHTDIFWEGYHAHKDGFARSDCPYSFAGDDVEWAKCEAWRDGWDYADSEV